MKYLKFYIINLKLHIRNCYFIYKELLFFKTIFHPMVKVNITPTFILNCIHLNSKVNVNITPTFILNCIYLNSKKM